MALDNNPHDLNSAEERKQYFDDVMKNPDLTKYDPDVISMKLGDSGNEAALAQLKEMADTSSGELGLMHTIERDVDESMARYDGSRSQNLSEGAQVRHEVAELKYLPVMRDGGDMNPVVAAIYMALLPFGISHGQLNEAMGVGGPDNDRATLDAFHDMAEDVGFHELVEYIQDADKFAMSMQIENGMKDVDPAIGTTPEEPNVAIDHDLILAQQLEQNVDLGGPTAPTAPGAPV